jgi:hypothetical protein
LSWQNALTCLIRSQKDFADRIKKYRDVLMNQLSLKFPKNSSNEHWKQRLLQIKSLKAKISFNLDFKNPMSQAKE